MDLAIESNRITGRLKNYFNSNLTEIALKGRGEVKEISIATPFLLYDGTNLELRLRQTESDTAYHGMKIGEKENKVILHDNSKIYIYLLDEGIDLLSKLPEQRKYRDFVTYYMTRNKFGFNERQKWFYSDPANKNSGELILFMHSLQRISSLILTKTLRYNPQR
ncbi:MAG: hypothetical protein AABY15_04770 [Nanoarchaeota archaeon]